MCNHIHVHSMYMYMIVRDDYIIIIIITLFCSKHLQKGVLLYIHINFCLSLCLALLVFIAGIETAVSIKVRFLNQYNYSIFISKICTNFSDSVYNRSSFTTLSFFMRFLLDAC